MVRAVSPRVVIIVAGMADLVVSHLLKGGHAIDDAGGDAVIGVCISQGLSAFKALLGDVR